MGAYWLQSQVQLKPWYVFDVTYRSYMNAVAYYSCHLFIFSTETLSNEWLSIGLQYPTKYAAERSIDAKSVQDQQISYRLVVFCSLKLKGRVIGLCQPVSTSSLLSCRAGIWPLRHPRQLRLTPPLSSRLSLYFHMLVIL